MNTRELVELIPARPSSDGAGVKLLRVFGGSGAERFDPSLLLDEFGSKQSSDYIGGFPSHPHRGFQTVTYMLAGNMQHRDHLGEPIAQYGPFVMNTMKEIDQAIRDYRDGVLTKRRE